MTYRKINRRRRKKRKHPGRNLHHLRPKSRRGDNTEANLLLIDVEKHALLHKIFGNKTWEEIIQLMIRVSRMKGRTKELREIRAA